jgi:transposase InsO family protein
MSKDIERFVKTCDICQRIKSNTQKPFGTLNPIPPPTTKFDTYSLDFIGPLPRTKSGYDGILVIVDTFSKLVTLTPIEFQYGAKEVAQVVYDRIVSRFGAIKKIISDRDPRFTGAFWKRLFKLHGTKIALSTAYHPQSDGQTERTNRTLEQVIRSQINSNGDNWDTLLPMAEFAINTTVNVSTGFSPFHLTYGTDPKSPVDLDVKESTTPAAEEFVKQMNDNINKARDNILKAQQSQKTQADKHRRDHTFQIGDQVMLSTKNLHFSTSSRKLLPRWVGPFNIVKQIHKDTFELDLRGTFHIHPTFHVALLKPYQENDPTIFPNRTQDPPAPIIIDNEEEYHVKKILKHRKISRKMQYLI